MRGLLVISIALALCALAFAYTLIRKVLSYDAGTDRMKEIAAFIHEGASAFLMAEYRILIFFVAILFVLIGAGISWASAVCFLIGAAFSTAAGYIGMNVATRANVRTAAAAKDHGMNAALSVAFSGGAVMGMCVVGFGLLGLGASSIALFARVGGGIYTKAADVGADLVGKVETGIPEDDPRNPATIADNVGDNVGDVAGMGADLFESYVGSLVSAIALGVAFYELKGGIFPLIIAALGIAIVYLVAHEHIDHLQLQVVLIKCYSLPFPVLEVIGTEHLRYHLQICNVADEWFALLEVADILLIFGTVLSGYLCLSKVVDGHNEISVTIRWAVPVTEPLLVQCLVVIARQSVCH